MKAAIYTRQSLFRADSCSLEVQEKRCIALCEAMGWDWEVYSDPDYSGKNIERPEFQRLMADARDSKFDVLVVYKLDRLSRSLKDFSNLMEELQELGVDFKSINENFDTSTPIGRAMVAIIIVFAQLERETTAERVRDNMLERARMGLWNGGKPNLGFTSEKEVFVIGGKEKTLSRLVVVAEEVEQVKQYFEWYMAPNGSVRQNILQADENGWTTTENGPWNTFSMTKLLKNPIYCVADETAYNYFESLGVEIAKPKSEWNGTHGVLPYNRTKQVKDNTVAREEDQWVISIGEHPGVIPSRLFVAVQKKLQGNQSNKGTIGRQSKLGGLLRCAKCGSPMSVQRPRPNYTYYVCRDAQLHRCAGNRVPGRIIETAIETKIKELAENGPFVDNALACALDSLNVNTAPLQKDKQQLEKQIRSLEDEENNLIEALGKRSLPEKLIERRIKVIEEEKRSLEEKLRDIDIALRGFNNHLISVDMVKNVLKQFADVYDLMEYEEQCNLLKSLVSRITYDEGQVDLDLFFVPRDTVIVGKTVRGENPTIAPTAPITTIRSVNLPTLVES